jgi:hypothetical protein
VRKFGLRSFLVHRAEIRRFPSLTRPNRARRGTGREETRPGDGLSGTRLRCACLSKVHAHASNRRPCRGASLLWSRPPLGGWLASASLVDVGGVRGLVVYLSRGPNPVRARAASWAVGPVEGARDLSVASRAYGLAEAFYPSTHRTGRSSVACRVEPGAATPGVGGVLTRQLLAELEGAGFRLDHAWQAARVSISRAGSRRASPGIWSAWPTDGRLRW